MGATVTIVISNANDNVPNHEVQIYSMTEAIATSSSSTNEDISVWYCSRSKSLFAVGRLESALHDAKSAIFYNPQNPEAYYLAAKLSHMLNFSAEAASFGDRALALEPENGPTLALIDELKGSQSEVEEKAVPASSASHHSASLYAWGSGESGQLGIGSLTSKPAATAINELRGKIVQDIACGAVHSCAVVNGGDLYAWGDNSRGQLGYATTVRFKASPSLVPKLVGMRMVAISAGAAHTIAISEGGMVFGWGIAGSGQLGPTNNNNQESYFYEPRQITCMNGKNVSSVACGLAHTVFLLNIGVIECCGMNEYGQLGLPPSASEDRSRSVQFTPIRPPRIQSTEIVHVSCGGAHTILIDSEGYVLCSGSNTCGQLGDSSEIDKFEFQKIPIFGSKDTLIPAAFSACGEEFSMIVTRKQAVYSFGLGLCYQLGHGNALNLSIPTKISALDGKQIETISCSQGQVLAIGVSGDVWTWGLPGDKAHMFAISDSVVIKTPEKVIELGKTKRVRQIACGRKHIICSTTIPNGSNSQVIKGLSTTSDDVTTSNPTSIDNGFIHTDLVLRAGERKVLVLQSRDTNGDLCMAGGALVVGRIEHTEVITNQMKKRLMNSGHRDTVIQQALQPEVIIDDNFDGTYSCTLKLYFTGLYRLTLSLNSMDINGSPFDVLVTPGKIHAPNCSVWWGRYAVIENAEIASGDGFGTQLKCECGDAMAFTVSCRDLYGNKFTDFLGHSVELELRTSTNEWISTSNITHGSNGIVPCFIQTKANAPGEYFVEVSIDSIGEHVEGSPFKLTTSTRVSSIPTPQPQPHPQPSSESSSTAAAATMDIPMEIDTISSEVNGLVADLPIDPQFLALHRQEITRRRAEDALRKERARLVLEREERRRQKSVKRTGGGFIIQYSKDI